MGASIDGQRVFEENPQIEIESCRREYIEKTTAGLDGIVSIDLGQRGRIIRQKGTIRAESFFQLDRKITEITEMINGNTHTLATSEGEEFGNLRMDSFKVSHRRTCGNSFSCDYEILYTQLVV